MSSLGCFKTLFLLACEILLRAVVKSLESPPELLACSIPYPLYSKHWVLNCSEKFRIVKQKLKLPFCRLDAPGPLCALPSLAQESNLMSAQTLILGSLARWFCDFPLDGLSRVTCIVVPGSQTSCPTSNHLGIFLYIPCQGTYLPLGVTSNSTLAASHIVGLGCQCLHWQKFHPLEVIVEWDVGRVHLPMRSADCWDWSCPLCASVSMLLGRRTHHAPNSLDASWKHHVPEVHYWEWRVELRGDPLGDLHLRKAAMVPTLKHRGTEAGRGDPWPGTRLMRGISGQHSNVVCRTWGAVWSQHNKCQAEQEERPS